jgi:hypothetical protein
LKKHQKARSKKICYRISCKGKKRPEGGGGRGGREISTKSVELTHLLAVGSAGAGRPAGTLCVSTARHDDDDGRTSINEQEISRSD